MEQMNKAGEPLTYIIRPGEPGQYSTRRILRQVGRDGAEAKIGDVIKIITGKHEGELARILEICVLDETIYLTRYGWFSNNAIRFVAPTEMAVNEL